MENLLVDKIKKHLVSDALIDVENAIVVVLKEIILEGLNRTNFFFHALLHKITYQYLFYSLERYSRDLDFILFDLSGVFDYEKCLKSAISELSTYGIEAYIDNRLKSITAMSQILFIKIKVKNIYSLAFPNLDHLINKNQTLSIRCVLRASSNKYIGQDFKYIVEPTYSLIRTIDEKTSFSETIKNILFSKWESSRVNSLDLSDFLRYCEQETYINYSYLNEEIKKYADEFPRFKRIDLNYLKKILRRRFEEIDFDLAFREIRNLEKNYYFPIKWDKYLFLTYLDKIKDIPQK